jgi:hypothetical protein
MRKRRKIATSANAAAAWNDRIDVVIQQVAEAFCNKRPSS